MWSTRAAVAVAIVAVPSIAVATPIDAAPRGVAVSDAEGCDPLDTRLCYLPFPSNHYTVADDTAETGRRVAFPQEGAPVNVDGRPLDVGELNRNDGFSPNTTILTHVPDLDAQQSALPQWTDLAASVSDTSPVVMIDTDSGERIPLWVELDSRGAGDPNEQLLVIHPADVLTEGHTYAVALRNLVDGAGSPIDANEPFASIRDNRAAELDDPGVVARAEALSPALDALDLAGIERAELYLAWDFTVASESNITGRMVHIRDETLSELGDAAPPYAIGTVTDRATDGANADLPDGVARRVTGTFTVTNWLTGDGSPGQRFFYGDVDPAAEPDALPVANGTIEATFQCNIVNRVMDADQPGNVIQYGHGLLGGEDEIDSDAETKLGTTTNSIVCGTSWDGMSAEDIPNAANALADMSNFPTMADRLQQGVLNQLVMTRLLLADAGLVADPAFLRPDGSPLFRNADVKYVGNSQGGIMGVMLAGVSTDIDRFVVGVAGINYGLLLPRSSDFTTYEQIFGPAYPSAADRALILSMIQMLWDRGEGAGYVSHVTADPLPGTLAKEILVHVAFGDWQVTELSAFVAARAMDVPVHRPVTADGRSQEVEPGWGLDSIGYSSDGSGLVIWDSGSDPIPIPNVAPSTSRDPHEDPRRDPKSLLQINSFLFHDRLVDVCIEFCLAAPRD
jgi:hypothetical protein